MLLSAALFVVMMALVALESNGDFSQEVRVRSGTMPALGAEGLCGLMGVWCGAVFARVRTSFDGTTLRHRGVFSSRAYPIADVHEVTTGIGWIGTMPIKLELRDGRRVRLHTFDASVVSRVDRFAATVDAYAKHRNRESHPTGPRR